LELFRHLETCKHKTLNGKEIKKVIIANHDDKYSREFLAHQADEKIEFTTKQYRQQFTSSGLVRILKAHDIHTNDNGVIFTYRDEPVQTQLLGEYNAKNIMTAFSIGEALGLTTKQLIDGIASVQGIPGRMEKIEGADQLTVIVDYAFEPKAMNMLYETVEKIQHNKVIHVLGGTGGGRDKSRREKIGGMAGDRSDMVIVTNEDPYDEDPLEIMEAVAQGAEAAGKKREENLLLILDRKEAIAKAIELAESGDVILVTGKGCEQAICVENEKKIPWDDREVVRELLKNV
jgi:UDP-N-acetylmuramyl tripeptide synthase